MRISTTTWSSGTVLVLICVLSLTLSHAEAASRRTGSRRGGKTHGRSYSNRNNNAQSQSSAHQAVQSAPKQAAPPGSVAATKAHAAPSAASAPQAPAGNSQPIGWNVNNNNAQKPVGPPPAYPGLGHNYAAPGGAPPAYSPYGQRPPGYFQGQPGHTGGTGYPQQPPPHYQQSYNPYMQHHGMTGGAPMGGYGGAPMSGGYGGGMYGGQNNFGMMGGAGMGMGMMGGGGMGMMGYPQQRKSSMFSFSNIMTGVALYSVYRSLTGGFGGGYGGGYNNYGPREVHIYDHREHKPSDPNDLKPIMGTLGLPQSVTGEKIDLPAKTMEEIAQQTPVQNVTTTTIINGTATEQVIEDPLPPLPFDNQPKIYFGYGYAFGYQNATVDWLSAVDGRKLDTATSVEATSAGPMSSTGLSSKSPESTTLPQPEENISTTTTDNDAELRASTTTMKSQVA